MRSLRPACPIGMENLSAPQLENLWHHPLFSIPKLQAVDRHPLKAEWLARLEAREPDHLREGQVELPRYGQTGESLRGRLLAAATAPLAPLMPLDSFPIAIGRRV